MYFLNPLEQRRQKVEEYLSRKKTFSGMPIHENETSIRYYYFLPSFIFLLEMDG